MRPRTRQVLLPSRYKLRDNEIVNFEADGHAGVRVRSNERDDSVPPALGQHSRGDRDTLAVVAELLVERRVLADGPIDLVALSLIGVVPERHVHLDRSRGFLGQSIVVEGAEDRLAPDDEDVWVIDDGWRRVARGRAAPGSRSCARGCAPRGQDTCALVLREQASERGVLAELSPLWRSGSEAVEDLLDRPVQESLPLIEPAGGLATRRLPLVAR